MPDTPALAAALVAFQAEMPTVHKGKTASVPTKSGGSYSYTYADLADVVEAATPLLTSHGLAFTARPRRTEQGDYELVGVLTHASGEEKEGALPLHGRTAQEIGSSITYGRRYLLGCMTGIVTDDDDDGQTAQPAQQMRRAPSAEENRQADLNAARAEMRAAWEAQGLEFSLPAVREQFEKWSGGSNLDAASPGDLRAFAGSLGGAA